MEVGDEGLAHGGPELVGEGRGAEGEDAVDVGERFDQGVGSFSWLIGAGGVGVFAGLATVGALAEISGRTERLADNPTLARSIRARFPYLDPLNHVQVELLRRYRSGDRDPRLLRGIHLTINGLAAGLRNSG